MKMTVEFVDVYDGSEHTRTETVNVHEPPLYDDDLEDWADNNLFVMTGDGRGSNKDAGYFATIMECGDRQDLVGREFSWGI